MKNMSNKLLQLPNNNFYNNHSSLLSTFRHFLFGLIIICLNSNLSKCKYSRFIKVYESKIDLQIIEKGPQNILSNSFPDEPSDVLVNGISKKEECSKTCDIEQNSSIVTLIFEEGIDTCDHMFKDMTNIKEIDLSNFDASKVITMEGMFENCQNLEIIIFGNINTSKVELMNALFYQCKKLVSIDVSKFDTSNVVTMQSMFSNCISLEYLDVSNFNTSKVENMFDIFGYCENLVTINVSSFDTSHVKNMQGMFHCCKNLKYLDLSNFDTSSQTNIINYCSSCDSLVYVNLKSFNIATKENLGFPKTAKVCIDDITSKNNLFGNDFNADCSDNCFKENIKVDNEQNICVEKCDEKKFEFNKICYDKCPNSYQILIDSKKICTKTIPDNYYFDISDEIYKECFKSCQKCYGPGNIINNNCSSCKTGFKFINDSFANERNCYKSCEYYYYFNGTNNYICLDKNTCPENYKKLIQQKKKCIDKCKNDDIYIYEYNNICFEKCPNGTNIIETLFICFDSTNNNKDSIIASFKNKIINGELDDILKNITENKIDYIQRNENIIYQITTSENQNNNKKGDISTIELGNCEKRLKHIYKIEEHLPLIIFKVDYYISNTSIPIIGYEIYHPLNKSKLDMNYCEDILLKLNIPVSIDEDNLFKYEPKNEYYTDNCYSYTTENGTDIVLSDRKKEFSNNNLSLCEKNCDYIGYSKEIKNTYCNCGAKNQIDLIENIIDNPNNLMSDFSPEEKNSYSSSVITMKCTKTLFTKNGLLYNISSYIIIFIFTFFLISIILFMKCGYFSLKQDIDNILNKKRSQNRQKDRNTNNIITERTSKINKRKKGKKKKKGAINFQMINNINIVKENNMNSLNKLNKKNNISDKKTKKESNKTLLNMNKTTNGNKNSNKRVFNSNKNKKIEFNDSELNNLPYKNAIIYDKRTFCQYYISSLKPKIPIIFAFLPQKDNNSKIIKMCIFFLSFSVYYAINLFFFDEKMIHSIYENEGKYDYLFFIPKIIISFVISHIISILIKFIFVSERNILNIKIQTSLESSENIAEKEKRNLFCKYVIFFILGIIFLGFFWFLLSSFGAVYINTQIIVFENTLISYAISYIYAIFINVLPCIFRIPSLNSKDKNKEYIYIFSKFLQVI